MKNQQGAALIISLIFMVLLTVVGLSTMHSSTLEVKIAKSVKSQLDAMNAAEDALSSGESSVSIGNLGDISNVVGKTGFYQGASLARLSSLDDLLSRTASTTTASTITQRIYVEYLGVITPGGNSGAFGNAGIGNRHLFRVTGVGQLSGGQTKVTQSYFATTE